MPDDFDKDLSNSSKETKHDMGWQQQHFWTPEWKTNEEIVLSGFAARLPESENVDEFKDKIMEGFDFVTEDDRRWPPGLMGLPPRAAKLKDVSKFDADFFGVPQSEIFYMDPQHRILLETAAEAVFDAGFNPFSLSGANIGVFVGVCFSDAKEVFSDPHNVSGDSKTLGCSLYLTATNICKFFNFVGPSFACDTACSSTTMALHQAIYSIRIGECDAAIVCGSQLNLLPHNTRYFHLMNMLSIDGKCRTFDAECRGYARSDAIGSLFLQKSSDARRIYATMVHTKTNTDGYKIEGLTYPSREMQRRLLSDTYEEAGINPADIVYMEAHGTGTPAGDPEEVNAITDVFFKKRRDPLLIGSVKSNVGHSEGGAGISALAKVIIAMETGVIPRNLHFKTPNPNIPAILDGRIQVVDKNTPFPGGLIGMNAFGFGGANIHVIMKSNTIEKKLSFPTRMPRLVTASGRVQEAVGGLLKQAEDNPGDSDFISLLDAIHAENIPKHDYRGYALVGLDGHVKQIEQFSGGKRPVWFVFSGMGTQWAGMGRDLMTIEVFQQSILRSASVLQRLGFDLLDIITNSTEETFDDVVNSFSAVTSVQVALVDLLNYLGIQPDGIVGHSIGEVACAYADGCFTAEQAVLTSFYRARAIKDSNISPGKMAVVGLTWEQVKARCPPDVVAACHNAPKSVTISGPADSVTKFLEEVNKEGVFNREVKNANIPFHSHYISAAAPTLMTLLKKVIPIAKPRSARWVSSSVPKEQWNTAVASSSSAEYHVNNLVSPVYFVEALQHVPDNAVVIEVAPHALLQSPLKQSLHADTTKIGLNKRDVSNNLDFFLAALGKMYVAGLQPKIGRLYPAPNFPVGRGTPMIAPLIKWDHSMTHHVPAFEDLIAIGSTKSVVTISTEEEEHSYVTGHCIDGRVLYPATGYLTLVWDCLSTMRNTCKEKLPVVFENVQYHRATILQKDAPVKLHVNILTGGQFEISEGGTAVVTGKVYVPEDVEKEMIHLPPPDIPEEFKGCEPIKGKDFYKELRLRGYEYKNKFQGLVETTVDGLHSKVTWLSNWVTFMDTILQVGCLKSQLRILQLPTRIEKVIIDPKKHLEMASAIINAQGKQEISIPTYMYPELKTIRSGGVEIRGLEVTSAPRRQNTGVPLLESYQFIPYEHQIPNDVNLETAQQSALRVCVDVAMENTITYAVAVAEVRLESNADKHLMSPGVLNILNNYPILQVEGSVITPSAKAIDESVAKDYDIRVVERDPMHGLDKAYHIVYGSEILSSPELLSKVAAGLKDARSFVIAEEKTESDVDNLIKSTNFEVVVKQIVGESQFVLLRKKATENFSSHIVVQLAGENFQWVDGLKKALKAIEGSSTRNVILVSEGEEMSGIIGMVNCLRLEPGGSNIRCVYIRDGGLTNFSLEQPIFKNQLQKGLIMNVYQDGAWGSYRHLSLTLEKKMVEHAYVNTKVRGDLSSLTWLESHLKIHRPENTSSGDLIQIYYAPLNFRDIMMATGKIPVIQMPGDIVGQDCVMGLEFAGRDPNGRRVVGMVTCRALASTIVADPTFLWDIPEGWTMEEAASVPCVYATVLYAFVLRGGLKKGESLLIHAGSGGVGLAAITIALSMGCTVYTTVGTTHKREFLKARFPQLTDRHIGNSRDCSFEQLVMRETKGRGVDIVLNSLADDKLKASLRCVTYGGRFLEIGKFDITRNSPMPVEFFRKGCTMHGVLLDAFFGGDSEEKDNVSRLVGEGLKSGVIQPLPTTVFGAEEVEKAIRYMAAGKHMGKVMLKVRDEEKEKIVKPTNTKISAVPRTYFQRDHVYIIIGGLGGFGMELAGWMVERGATRLVLTSRTGIKNGYQRLCLRRWESLGASVKVSTADVRNVEGAKELMKEAAALGTVGGIFHLAVVLHDAIMENQTPESYRTAYQPKLTGLKNLDLISREQCPELEYFVAFSSVSCGRGNPGQSNYGLANSAMERLCEERKKKGLPALVVQWGAIGDVGLVAETMLGGGEMVIGGTLTQRIPSCLAVLDGFLQQDHTVVGSMVVAEKNRTGDLGESILVAVAKILGLSDLSNADPSTSLLDLGLDSLMGVEIKQLLERHFDVLLNAQEIRNMTLGRLVEISKGGATKPTATENTAAQSEPRGLFDFNYADWEIPKIVVEKLESLPGKITNPPLFIVHPLEGIIRSFKPLASRLRCEVYGIQPLEDTPVTSMEQLAEYYLQEVKQVHPKGPYRIGGYSLGSTIALEMCLQLENAGEQVMHLALDGSPTFVKTGMHCEKTVSSLAERVGLEVRAIHGTLQLVIPVHYNKLEDQLLKCKNWEERIASAKSMLPEPLSKDTLNFVLNRTLDFFVIVSNWIPKRKLKGKALLIRVKEDRVVFTDDYNLSDFCEQPAAVHRVTGSHQTFLDEENVGPVADIVTEFFDL